MNEKYVLVSIVIILTSIDPTIEKCGFCSARKLHEVFLLEMFFDRKLLDQNAQAILKKIGPIIDIIDNYKNSWK